MADPTSDYKVNQENYLFTTTWFETHRQIWSTLIPQINPSKILEVGSYEGASSCFLINTLASTKEIEIHCIDNWEGGVEHKDWGTDMQSVEVRFKHNIDLAIRSAKNKVDLQIHKGFSDIELSKLLVSGKTSYFDFIYIDGSHQAPDVICDAILGFKLLRAGGIMVFDDYLWAEDLPYGHDPIRSPKLAIDAFTNIYCRMLNVLSVPLYQLFIQKRSD